MNAPHPLIEALQKAAADPGARQAFYELLMKSTVFVPGLKEEGQEGAAPRIGLKQWPQPEGFMATPFFATLEDLRQVLKEDEPHLTLPALELFQLTRGATLVLATPGGGAKAFKPDEVEALLSSRLAVDLLAAALEKAVKENTDRAKNEFYNLLVNSQVFVFGEPKTKDGDPGPTGLRTINPEDQFIITTVPHPHAEDQRIIPFFSSGELLQLAAKGASLTTQAYLGFSVLTLFNMARSMGLPLVMNPGPTVYKIFARDEVDFILEHIRQEPFERRQFKAGGQVLLGPPEVYPRELVDALKIFLPSLPGLKAAYLTTLRENAAEAEPTLVIGFETDAGADLPGLLRQAGPVAARHAQKGQTIDFAQIVPGEKGLSQFFLDKVTPFYRQAAAQGENLPAPSADRPEARASYEAPGFFGRLKRIFKG
ncbi:hypothetical protein FACS189460_1290 [Deltaproteobacteria bacterium]|nr:hypothetical protein FACS189460_1080 [Deltaproteobacteria bacterium]GHV56462.1 hypothetical protein FACS189460_1290 [Deltaproteobacteria bacterium]